MNPVKIEAILRAIVVLDALSGDRAEYRLGEIARWAKIPRSTCDRYLRSMERSGLLVHTVGWYRGDECRMFSITNVGRDFYRAIY